MANVGTVQSVTGLVRAIAEDGSERVLSVGDTVAENERIITGDGVIVIAFTDGTVMDLGGNSSIVLNDDVLNPEGDGQVAQSRESAGDEVAALQQALSDPNFDPTAELPATAAGAPAAGGTGGNNGHTVASVDYLNPNAPVESGHDTVGISQEFSQVNEELPPVPVAQNSDPVLPTAGSSSVAVDEDGLGRDVLLDNFFIGGVTPLFQGLAQVFDGLGLGFSPGFANPFGSDSDHQGIQGGPGDANLPTPEYIASGNLSYDFGDAGSGDVDFSSLDGQLAKTSSGADLTSEGNAVSYIWDAGTHTLVAAVGGAQGEDGQGPSYPVFSITVTDIATGAYTVVLFANVDHSIVDTEDNLLLDLPFTVTDGSGNTAQGSLAVDIDDDSPEIAIGQSTDSASEFTVVNHDEESSAGYHNSYGFYVKTLDANGAVISDDPTIGVIVETDVHFQHGGFTNPLTVLGYSQEQIGYFLIPNGDGRNSGLTDGQDVTFAFVGGQWQAFTAGGAPIIGAGSHVLFDLAALNSDGQDHMVDNGLTGNQNWEDLQIPRGDGDYNDVNVNVDWTKVTVTGDVVESVAFGADGAESGLGDGIDFSFSASDITSNGMLTSNGGNISFEARDTNSDGENDQIVGVANGNDVLTIDGVLDGDYDVSILGPIDDGTPDVDVDINVHVAATDGDGDVSTAILNININFDLNQVLVDPVPTT